MMDDQLTDNAPINSLSNEVLLIIFKFWQLLHHDAPSIIRLCQVCKRWRWLITNTASAHSMIWNSSSKYLEKRLESSLKHGTTIFLSVRWFQNNIASHLSLVQQIIKYISVLNLEGPGACQLLKNNENNLASLSMTQLSLHNNVDEFPAIPLRSVYTPDSELRLISTDAPQLRSLSLQGHHPLVGSPLFSTTLVRLELVCIEQDDSLEKYDLNSLLDKLSHMPSLRELVVRRVLSEPEDLPSNLGRSHEFDHLEKLVMEAQRPSGMPIYQLLSNSLQRRGVERHVERYFIVRAKDIKASELPPIVDIDENSTLDIIVVSIAMMRLQFHGKAPTNDQPRVSEVILRPAESLQSEWAGPLPTLFSRLESTMTQVKKLRIVEQERPHDSPAEVPDMDLSTIDWRRALLRIPVTHLSVSTITHSNLEAFVRSIDVPAPASTPAIERPRQPLPELTELDILKECWSVNDRKKVILPFLHRDNVSIFVDGETLYSNKPGILGRQDTLMVLDEE